MTAFLAPDPREDDGEKTALARRYATCVKCGRPMPSQHSRVSDTCEICQRTDR